MRPKSQPSGRAAARRELFDQEMFVGTIQIFQPCSLPVSDIPCSFGKYIIRLTCTRTLGFTQPQGAPLPGGITKSYFFFAENLRNGVTWGRKSARGCNVTPPENLFCPESVVSLGRTSDECSVEHPAPHYRNPASLN